MPVDGEGAATPIGVCRSEGAAPSHEVDVVRPPHRRGLITPASSVQEMAQEACFCLFVAACFSCGVTSDATFWMVSTVCLLGSPSR